MDRFHITEFVIQLILGPEVNNYNTKKISYNWICGRIQYGGPQPTIN